MDKSIFDLAFNEWRAYEFLEFIVKYIIPIIGTVAIIIGGIWTAYKFFKEKNKAFYTDILKNVYQPLFAELVKMEYSRKLLKDSIEIKNNNKENSDSVHIIQDNVNKKTFSVKEVPFIKWGGTRTNTTIEIGKTSIKKEEYDVYDFENILKEIHDTPDRLMYAPRDLVSLIESYFFLEQVKGVPTYEIEHLKLQKCIRKNVIIGYKKYRRKLGLKDVSFKKFCRSIMGYVYFR